MPERIENETVKECARKVVKKITKHQQLYLKEKWKTSSLYARLACAESSKISFPALKNINLEGWMFSRIHEAEVYQIHGLGANPLNRRRFRFGCAADESAYHVVAACPSPEKTIRHNTNYLLRGILRAASAPEEVLAQVKYATATVVADYKCGNREVKLRAGVKMQTDPQLYHNQPDIVIYISDPKCVYVFEIEISYLQNLRMQEKLKLVRYAKYIK